MSIGFQQAEQVARNAGDRIGQNFHQISQENKIDQILKNAANAPNPQDAMNNAMTQILAGVDKESQGPVIEEIQRRGAQLEKQRQRGAQQQAGYNPDLPESINKSREAQKIKEQERGNILNRLGGKNTNDLGKDDWMALLDVPGYEKQAQQKIKEFDKAEEYYQKKEQEVAPIRAALETVDELEEVLEDNYYSYGPLMGKINQSPDARNARQQIVTLGNSLLGMASQIPVRNQREFDAVLKALTNPNSTYATNIGSVQALRKMFSAKLGSTQGTGGESSSGETGAMKQKQTTKIDQNAVNEMF